jgi:hypothetical protein
MVENCPWPASVKSSYGLRKISRQLRVVFGEQLGRRSAALLSAVVADDKAGVLFFNGPGRRKEFKRVSQQLQARGLIGVNDELVWKA